MQNYNKLVRDKIPQYIKSQGKECETRILTDKEFKKELYNKLREETEELIAKQEGLEEGLINEIADIYEVIDAIIKLEELDKGKILEYQKKKGEERGGFENKIFLIRS